MKFGIMNLFPSAGEAEDHQVLHDTLEEIRIADRLGFDSVWLAEHHFSRYGILGNPLQFGAAIAASTANIMIGTAVMVVPFHDPIRLAEEGAALDVISKGRFQMGVGRGYQPREFKGFGVDPAESHERYDEAVEIVQRAWTQEGWSFQGRYFSYEDLTTYPRPFQEGGPPLVHGAVSPSSFRKRGLAGANIITSPNFTPLGRMKDNFEVYRASLVEAGHDPARFELPFMQQIWVGEDTAGLREAAEAALHYYRSVGKVIPDPRRRLPPRPPTTPRSVRTSSCSRLSRRLPMEETSAPSTRWSTRWACWAKNWGSPITSGGSAYRRWLVPRHWRRWRPLLPR